MNKFVVIVTDRHASYMYGPFMFRMDAESFIVEHDNSFAGRTVHVVNLQQMIQPVDLGKQLQDAD